MSHYKMKSLKSFAVVGKVGGGGYYIVGAIVASWVKWVLVARG